MDAYDILLRLYGPTWCAVNVEPSEREGVSGFLCHVSTGKIGRAVQLERLKVNGLRAEIVSPGKVFVAA